MTLSPIRVWLDRNGALLRLRLARPRANIIDAAMVAALGEALHMHRGASGLLGVLLDAEGPSFSFGASVEEHVPPHCVGMLRGLHRLLIDMLEWPAPILVAVRGQCLGGGLELALAGSLIFAARDVRFAQPETRLGLFAPAASCLLPPRIGQAAAEDLLLSGRSVEAAEANRMGLAHACDDPEAAALAYFDRELAAKSAAALACALAAARDPYLADMKKRLDRAEHLYLDRLMATRDAAEGLAAFLARRTPVWEHR